LKLFQKRDSGLTVCIAIPARCATMPHAFDGHDSVSWGADCMDARPSCIRGSRGVDVASSSSDDSETEMTMGTELVTLWQPYSRLPFKAADGEDRDALLMVGGMKSKRSTVAILSSGAGVQSTIPKVATMQVDPVLCSSPQKQCRDRSVTPPSRRKLARKDTGDCPVMPARLKRKLDQLAGVAETCSKVGGLSEVLAKPRHEMLVACANDVERAGPEFTKHAVMSSADQAFAAVMPITEMSLFLEATRRSPSPRRID